MPREGIRESIIVEGVKDKAWDQAGVEWERHGGSQRTLKMSSYSGVCGNQQRFGNFSAVQLLGQLMLHLSAYTFSTHRPIVTRHVKAGREV